MTNTKKFKFKNLFCTLIIAFCMMIPAFSGYHFNTINVLASSNYKYEDLSSSLFGSKGYNFNSETGVSPVKPSGWEEIKTTTNNDNETTDKNIVRGVVNVKDNGSFSSEKSKTSRPQMNKDESSDESYFKNLMINSHNGPGRFGYKSSSIKLEADSFYEITINLYTHRTEKTEDTEATDPNASIYITGLYDEETEEDTDLINSAKFESINTLQAWEDYTFYISTDEAKTINLELWLASKKSAVQGAVFFNHVNITRYSEDYFAENILTLEDTNENKFNIIEMSKAATSPVVNGSFETISPLNWEEISRSTELASDSDSTFSIVNVNTFSKLNESTTINTPGSNCSPYNQNALFIYNKVDGYQGVQSQKFTIDKHSYYKLTFWAKSDCNVGNGATVKLIDTTKDSDKEASLTLATTVTPSSNIFRNDWTQYTFYIYSDAFNNKEIAIQVWMGTAEKITSGYVFIDDFRMEETNYSDYSSNSASTNCTAFNINETDDKFTIANGEFNRTQNQDTNNTYPLTPADWTITEESSTNNMTLSGIVNLNETSFVFQDENKKPYNPSPVLPNKLNNKTDNNALMIGSLASNNKQTYRSAEFTLNANSYYKLSFYVNTNYVNNLGNKEDAGASFAIVSGARILAKYNNILFDDNDWHKFEIYIKTNTNSETAKIELSFDKLTGYVFFDDITLETSNETVYNDHIEIKGINYVMVDLSVESFNNRTYNTNLETQTPNNWKGAEADDNTDLVTSGITSIDNTMLSEFPLPPSGNENVLFINSPYSNVYYTFASNTSSTFTKSTYYKINVNILTNLIKSEDDVENLGATIGLKDSKDIFMKGIDTNGVWKNYTIYLYLEEDLNSPIVLALGNADKKACGQVLFDNLTITQLEEEAFNNEVKENDNQYFKGFINYKESDDSDEDHDHSDWNNEFNWLIIPSLITGLAIIIAVIGFYAKKIKFNKKPRIKTKYDRRKTLDKDIDKREKIALRQQIINELNEELLSIDREIEECNRLAEEQLQSIKQRLLEEQENIKKQKLDIEIKKKEATANREKQLKENPDLITNAKAEKEFSNYIAKLDKQEMSLQKQLTSKEHKLNTAIDIERKNKLARILERQEYIKNEIAKIEAEIEEIARQEEEMWAEYRQAKADAKRRKAEYKAQVKQAKEEEKASKQTKNANDSKPANTKKQTKKESSTENSEDSSKKEDK